MPTLEESQAPDLESVVAQTEHQIANLLAESYVGHDRLRELVSTLLTLKVSVEAQKILWKMCEHLANVVEVDDKTDLIPALHHTAWENIAPQAMSSWVRVINTNITEEILVGLSAHTYEEIIGVLSNSINAHLLADFPDVCARVVSQYALGITHRNPDEPLH